MVQTSNSGVMDDVTRSLLSTRDAVFKETSAKRAASKCERLTLPNSHLSANLVVKSSEDDLRLGQRKIQEQFLWSPDTTTR